MKNGSKPDFMVVVECCQNCSQHSWCSRHDEGKYDEHYLELKRKIEAEVPQAVVMKNQTPLAFKRLHSRFQQDNRYINEKTGDIVQYPRLGSFEVYAEGYLIFSKIQSNLWPCHNRMVALIYAMSLDKKNGKDLARFSLQNRIFHENDEVFKITYNRLIQKEILQQQNFGKYSRLNSSLQRSNIINSNGKLELTPQLKKGIKIRKISSSSKKKIEPLSYSHVDVVKRFDEQRSADVVSYTDKKNSNKYIRPIQKHRKEYDQFKQKRKVDIPYDNWRNDVIVSQPQGKDVVHKRPSVRIMKRVIDTKIDQKKSQQSPAQQKIPSKVQPIKVFLPQVNRLDKKQSPKKISHKQDQQDYQQLYDQQQEKQKKKSVPPVQEYDEQFEQQKSKRDTQKSQTLKGSIRSDIKQDIKPLKNSQKVEEIIEDFEYGQLTKSQNRNIKKKKPQQDIEQMYECIDQQVQDQEFNKRKQEQLKKNRIKQQQQRQKLRQQQIEKQRKLQQQKQIQQQKERQLLKEKEQKEKKLRQKLEAEKKQKEQQQRLKQELRKQQQLKKQEEIQKLEEERVQKQRKLKQQQDFKKKKQQQALKQQQQRLQKQQQIRKKQEQAAQLLLAQKQKQQQQQRLKQQMLLKQQRDRQIQEQREKQLLRIKQQQQKQQKEKQQKERKEKEQKQKAEEQKLLKEKQQKQRQLQQKQEKQKQMEDQRLKLQEQQKKKKEQEQEKILNDSKQQVDQYGEQFEAQQIPSVNQSKVKGQQQKIQKKVIEINQEPKQSKSITQIKPISEQQNIPTIHWQSKMVEGDYKMSNKEGIIFNATPSQSLQEIQVQKPIQNVQKQIQNIQKPIQNVQKPIQHVQKINSSPLQHVQKIEEKCIPQIHWDSKMLQGDYKMSNKQGIPFNDTPSQSLNEIQLEKIQQFKNQKQSSKIEQTQNQKPLISQQVLVQKIQIPQINWDSKMVEGDYRLSNRDGIPFDQTPGQSQHNIPIQLKSDKQKSNHNIVQQVLQKPFEKQNQIETKPIQIQSIQQILPILNWNAKFSQGRFVIVNNQNPSKQYPLEEVNPPNSNVQIIQTEKELKIQTVVVDNNTNSNKVEQKVEILKQKVKKQQIQNQVIEVPVVRWQAQCKNGNYFIKNIDSNQIFELLSQKPNQQLKLGKQIQVQSTAKVEIVPELVQKSIPYQPKIVYWQSGSVQGTFITKHIPQQHKSYEFPQLGSFKKIQESVEQLEEKYQQQFQNQIVKENKEDNGQQSVPQPVQQIFVQQTHWISRFQVQNYNLQKTTKEQFDNIVREVQKEQNKPFIQFVQSQKQVQQQYLKSQNLIQQQFQQSFPVTGSQIISLNKITEAPIQTTKTVEAVTYWQSKCSGQQFQTVKMIPKLVDQYLSNLLIIQKQQSMKSIAPVVQSQKSIAQFIEPVTLPIKQIQHQSQIPQQSIQTSNKIPIGLIEQVNVNWQSRYSNDDWSLTKQIPQISV